VPAPIVVGAAAESRTSPEATVALESRVAELELEVAALRDRLAALEDALGA
jgi:uncharacterized protein YceH (UPF0502 family)